MKKLKKISHQDLTRFTRQLATLTVAGIPLVEALSVVRYGIEKTTLGFLVQRLKMHLEKGLRFSEALKQYPTYFNTWYCGVVAAGEQSGTLDLMLQRMATHQEKRDALKRKIRKAMVYPIAVLIIASSVTLLMLLKVIPLFKELFRDSKTPLPPFTQCALFFSEMLQEHGLLILVCTSFCAFLIIHLYRNKKYPRFKQCINAWTLKLPFIGPLIHQTILARLTRTLATTLAAGIPLTEALHTLIYSTEHLFYHRMLLQIQQALKNGQALHIAMKPFKTLTPTVIQMVKIGEYSGTLDKMLDNIATLYEDKVEIQTDGLSALLEPTLMVILGLIVGALVIAMYLPIFNLGSVF